MLAWTFNDDRPLKGTPVKQGHNINVDSITREVRVKQRRDFNGESTLLLPRWNDVTISTLIRFAKSKGNSPLIQPWYLTLFQRWNNVEMPAGCVDSTHVHSFITWSELIMIQARHNEIEYINTIYILLNVFFIRSFICYLRMHIFV